MFDIKVVKVLNTSGDTINTIMLHKDEDPSNWGGVWDDEATLSYHEDLVRKVRNGLLEEIDLIALNPLRFNSLSDTEKQELSDKRQALLDVPQQAGFPYEIIWP